MLGSMHLLVLLAKANTQLLNVDRRTGPQWTEAKGQPTTVAMPSPAATSPATPTDAGEPRENPSPTPLTAIVSLPVEIYHSAGQGQLQKVVKWLRKGGSVNAFCPVPVVRHGVTSTATLLHTAAANGQLEIVRELLKRGASVNLQTSLGVTALMDAAYRGHHAILLLLLQHSANPDMQSNSGVTALIQAAHEGQRACVQTLLRAKANPDLQTNNGYTALMHAVSQGQGACIKALLRAKANTRLRTQNGNTALQLAEAKGHRATAALIRQHAAPPQSAATSPATPPDAGEPIARRESPPPTPLTAMGSPASLPFEIHRSAQRGKLQNVVEWLRKGGQVDALCLARTRDGQKSTFTLLHAAAANDQVEIVRELLKRGASIDLQSSLGSSALMDAAYYGHTSILRVLLQHSANLDLQNIYGATALMWAAHTGQEACVQVLLRAKANTELLEANGLTALQWAEAKGHTAIAALIQQHACLSPGLGVALCALPLAWPWIVHWVVLGAIASVAFSRTLGARPDQHRAARQRRLHRPVRFAGKAQGRMNTAETLRQRSAPPQPATTVARRTTLAAQAARADAIMEELLAEEAAEQAKGQAMERSMARSKQFKKKKKAGGAAAAGDASSEEPPAAAPAPPPTIVPKPAASGCRRLAWAWAQQKTEREAKQEAVVRLTTVEQALEVAAQEAVRAAAATSAREAAAAAAATAAAAAEAAVAAEAEAIALERAMASGSESGSSDAAGPSEAGEAAEVPDDYVCPITAEIMTDPVSTVDGFTYERAAITEWLRIKDTSPVTGATLENNTLIPNLSLRSMIRSFAE